MHLQHIVTKVHLTFVDVPIRSMEQQQQQQQHSQATKQNANTREILIPSESLVWHYTILYAALFYRDPLPEILYKKI